MHISFLHPNPQAPFLKTLAAALHRARHIEAAIAFLTRFGAVSFFITSRLPTGKNGASLQVSVGLQTS